MKVKTYQVRGEMTIKEGPWYQDGPEVVVNPGEWIEIDAMGNLKKVSGPTEEGVK